MPPTTVGPLNDRQRAYTDYIRASSVTLGVLIDNILDLATVDAGIAELRPELQDVAALVDKARAGLAATFPEIDGEKPLNLVVDIARRPAAVHRRRHPHRAGALQPAVERRALLRAGRRDPALGHRAAASACCSSSRTRAPPMTDEMRAAILERSDDAGLAGRQRGAGLGLAIVRAFVNLHGGTISVERREPRGSRVIVSLPRDGRALAGAAESSLTPQTLFLADDDATAALGAASPRVLRPGDLVLLEGDLGAGKTALARAIIRTLVGDPRLDVPSPTFALVQPYEANGRRCSMPTSTGCGDPREVDELGLFDRADAIVLVEWPERAPELAARRHWQRHGSPFRPAATAVSATVDFDDGRTL